MVAFGTKNVHSDLVPWSSKPENWKIWSEQIRSDQKNHYFSDLDLISDQYLSQWSWSDLRSFLRMIWSEMIWNFQIINLVHFFLNQTIFSEWYYIMLRGGCVFFQISFQPISINSCLLSDVSFLNLKIISNLFLGTH